MIKGKQRYKLKETQKKYINYLGKAVLLNDMIEVEGLLESELLEAVVKFYEKNSKLITKERSRHYQKMLKVTSKSIKIDKNVKRWGSCNSKKEITFNYLISSLPMELIDYIVVHELCHIYHMNHERSFWRKVGSIIPDYKKRIEVLEGRLK